MDVRIEYHQEDGSWWAESPELPGFFAAGSTLEEVRSEAQGGVIFYMEEYSISGPANLIEEGLPNRVTVSSSPSVVSLVASGGAAARFIEFVANMGFFGEKTILAQ